MIICINYNQEVFALWVIIIIINLWFMKIYGLCVIYEDDLDRFFCLFGMDTIILNDFSVMFREGD